MSLTILIEPIRLTAAKEKIKADIVEELVDISVLTPYLSFPVELNQEKEQNFKKFTENRIEGEDNIALVVRRFQPPHAGHLYSIEAALQVANYVVIGIGSSNRIDENNPFTADFREGILRDVFSERGLLDRMRFVRLKDYGNDNLWGRKTLEKAEQWGKIDLVVGNSTWVNSIFQKRGYRTLEVPELARDRYRSTLIRASLRASSALRSVGT